MRLDCLVARDCLEFAVEEVLAMHENPGWTAVYEVEWIAAGYRTVARFEAIYFERISKSTDLTA